MTLVADVNSSNWSMATTGQGDIVEGISEIDQTLGIILSNRKQSDPFRPTFGSDIWEYLDDPIPTAGPNMVRAIIEAIERWEPRIKLLSVTYNLASDNAQQSYPDTLQFSISWYLKSDSDLKAKESVAVFSTDNTGNQIIRILGSEDSRAIVTGNSKVIGL